MADEAKRPTNIKYDFGKYEKHGAFKVNRNKAGKAYAMRHRFKAVVSSKFIHRNVPADIKMSAAVQNIVRKKLVAVQKELILGFVAAMKEKGSKELSKEIVSARPKMTEEEKAKRDELRAKKAKEKSVARLEERLQKKKAELKKG